MEQRYQAVQEGKGVTLTHAEHWERMLSAAQGRYQRACESLARTRRLLQRAQVQINIAQQQVVQNEPERR